MNFFKKLFKKKKNIEFSLPVPINEQDTIGVRDSIIKSRSFFEKQVDRKEGYILRSKIHLKETQNKKKDDLNFDYYLFFNGFNMDIIDLIKAKYSGGYSIYDIVADCTPLMETTSRFWANDIDYSDGGDILFNNFLSSVSLGVLAGVDVKYFRELSEVMQEKKFSDFYIDFLVNSVYPEHPIAEKSLFEGFKSIDAILEILKTTDKKIAEQLLLNYLGKIFYTKYNLEIDYNEHNFEGARNYYGYWSWESAAIVKIKGLDDSLFKNNPYYPYELVHFTR